MTALGSGLGPNKPKCGGIEVKRIKGVGWGVYAWADDGWRDLLWVHGTAKGADKYAAEFLIDVTPGIMKIDGYKPTLQLSGGSYE